MAKSRISPIGNAILDLIETWQIAKDTEYVKKPISYALYHTWRRWDEKEKERKDKHGE